MIKSIPPFALLMILAQSAYAAEGHDHHNHGDKEGFYAHVEATVVYESIYAAPEHSEEVEQTYSHSHMELGYRFNKNFSIDSNIKIEGEPAGHAHGGGAARTGDQFFDAHPLVEQLTSPTRMTD